MEQIWVTVCNRAVAAGWLVLAVALLRLVFKNGSKRILLFFWLPVALRLLFPGFPESPFALVPDFWAIPQQAGPVRAPSVESGVQAVDGLVNPFLAQNLSPGNPSGSANPVQAVLSTMVLVWFVGAILLACYSLFSYIRFRLGIRDAVLVKYVDAKRPVPVYQSEKIASPYTIGVLSPRIYVPSSLPESAKDHVLAHEAAHICHQDHRIKGFAWLLMIVYWPFPLLWLGWFLFCKDLELACDERVIRQLGPMERCSYSETLLLTSAPKNHVLPCPLAFGAGDIKERVKSILQYRPPTFWAAALAIGAVMLLAVFFLTKPQKMAALPDAEELLYVEIQLMAENEEKTATVEDTAWNARLLAAMANVRKTWRRSIFDTPYPEGIDGNSYTAFTLRMLDGTAATYYLYAVNKKYYLEQPSGVYRTDTACHNLLMECMADKESDWASVSYGVHQLGKEGVLIGDLFPVSGTRATICRQVMDFYVQKKTDTDGQNLISELRRQLGLNEDSLSETEVLAGETARQRPAPSSYDRPAAAIETLDFCIQIDRRITGTHAVATLYVYMEDNVPYVQEDEAGAFLLDQDLFDTLLYFSQSGSVSAYK